MKCPQYDLKRFSIILIHVLFVFGYPCSLPQILAIYKIESSREANQFIQQFPSDNLHTSVVRVALRVHDFQSRAVSPIFMVYLPKTKSKKKYKTATTHFPKQPLTLNYLV